MPASKIAVILNSPSDWEEWIEPLKSHAVSHEIWEFIDPGYPQTQLSEPAIPTFNAVKDILITGRTPTQSDTSQTVQPTKEKVDQRLKIETTKYKQDYQQYLARKKHLAGIPSLIQSSINRGYLQYTYSRATAYDMVVALKERVAPSDLAKEIDISNQYRALKKPPTGRQLIDKWLTKWEEVHFKATQLNLPEVHQERAHMDFLDAIQNIDQEFHTVWSQSIIEKKYSNEPAISLRDLLERFRNSRLIHQAKQGCLLGGQSAFPATFKNKDIGGNTDTEKGTHTPSTNSDSNQGKSPPPRCIWGQQHWYSECPYVMPTARKPGWTPKPEIQQRFDNATDEQKKAIGRTIERAKAYQNKKAKNGALGEGSSSCVAPVINETHPHCARLPPIIIGWIREEINFISRHTRLIASIRSALMLEMVQH